MEEILLDIESLKKVKVYSVSYGASLPMRGLEANAAAARLQLSDISLNIELTDKTEFIQWITTKKKLSGTITILDATNGKPLRTVKFSDAYICSFQESFSGGGGGGTSISIACTAIDINNIKYDVRKGK